MPDRAVGGGGEGVSAAEVMAAQYRSEVSDEQVERFGADAVALAAERDANRRLAALSDRAGGGWVVISPEGVLHETRSAERLLAEMPDHRLHVSPVRPVSEEPTDG